MTEIVFQSCLPIQASSQCDPSGLTCNVSSLNPPGVNCVSSKYPIARLLTSGILAAKVTDTETFCESPVLVIFKHFFARSPYNFTTIGETQRHEESRPAESGRKPRRPQENFWSSIVKVSRDGGEVRRFFLRHLRGPRGGILRWTLTKRT